MEDYCLDGDTGTLRISAEVYSRDCVLKTAYAFLDRAYVLVDRDQRYFLVRLRPKEPDRQGGALTAQLAGEFQNELLNQQVRKTVMDRTRNVRELILARAMYSSYIEEPQLPEQSDEAYSIDDIAKDWFQDEER